TLRLALPSMTKSLPVTVVVGPMATVPPVVAAVHAGPLDPADDAEAHTRNMPEAFDAIVAVPVRLIVPPPLTTMVVPLLPRGVEREPVPETLRTPPSPTYKLEMEASETVPVTLAVPP